MFRSGRSRIELVYAELDVGDAVQSQNSTIVEKRNGCDIEKVSGATETFRVLSSRPPRHLIEENVGSLSEAQAIADRQDELGR